MTRFSLISHDAEISIHVKSMTRNANKNKMALLDLTTRHIWKVNKREENRILTVENIIDPKNSAPQNPQISRAFAGAFRMNWKRFDLSQETLKRLQDEFEDVLTQFETR